MKTSNNLLLLGLAALILGTLSYAFYLEPNVVLAPREIWPGKNPLVPGSSSEENELMMDTIKRDFHYLWTNFPEVKLDPSTKNEIKTYATPAGSEGYTYGKVDFIIERDTLFILHNNGLMTRTTPDDTTRVLHAVTVSSGQLRGIEVVKEGRIEDLSIFNEAIRPGMRPILSHRYLEQIKIATAKMIEDTPLTANKEKMLFELNKLTVAPNSNSPLITDKLHLHLRQGGKMNLNLEARQVSVSVTGDASKNEYSELVLWGKCGRLEVNHRNAYLSIDGFSFQADSVLVNSYQNMFSVDATIRVNAEKYLQAKINGWTNVLFQGKPTIEKKESLGGRVINANRYQ